jgi:hypothetical protein
MRMRPSGFLRRERQQAVAPQEDQASPLNLNLNLNLNLPKPLQSGLALHKNIIRYFES